MKRSFSVPVFPAVFLLFGEQAEHASRFLGLPLWIWQILNLVLFFAVLVYFIAKPMTAAFRKRQLDIEERAKQAEKERADVARLSTDIRERTARLEREIAEIRADGLEQGKSAEAALAVRAKEEAARVRKDAEEEIARRLAAARALLHKTAADLMAVAATELVSREMTAEDRQRLLEESVERMKAAR